MRPKNVEVTQQMLNALDRYERAEKNVQHAYYELRVSSFEDITHDPVMALQAARRAADKEREDALQVLGWYLARTLQGKM